MKKVMTLASALVLATSISGAALAGSHGGLQLNDQIKTDITSKLEGDGYTVGKIKIEDGMYEAYARKDGKRLEIYLDTDYNVVEIKED